MKPVAGFLRISGIRLVRHLDNMLIIGSTPQESRLFTQIAMNLLESRGFIINKEKSVPSPTGIITFLGFTIISITMLFILPSKKKGLVVRCASFQQGRFRQGRNYPSGPTIANATLVATTTQSRSAGAATNSSTNLNETSDKHARQILDRFTR